MASYPYRRLFHHLYGNLLLSVATFSNYLNKNFWIIPVASTTVLAACPGTFMLQRWLLSIKLKNQPLLASHFSSAAPSPLSVFTEFKRVRGLLRIGFWLKEMWPIYPDHSNFLLFSLRLFHFPIIGMFPGVALFFLSRTFPLYSFTTRLTVWFRRLAFGFSWLLMYLPHRV